MARSKDNYAYKEETSEPVPNWHTFDRTGTTVTFRRSFSQLLTQHILPWVKTFPFPSIRGANSRLATHKALGSNNTICSLSLTLSQYALEPRLLYSVYRSGVCLLIMCGHWSVSGIGYGRQSTNNQITAFETVLNMCCILDEA